MTARATLDPARELDLFLRINRDGQVTFNFLNTAGGAYSLTGRTFVLNIKRHKGDSENWLQLVSGAGLTIGGSSIVMSLTKAQSALAREQYYFWELVMTKSGQEKDWLTGFAWFHNGKFDGVSNLMNNLVIYDVPQVINLTINEVGGSAVVTYASQYRGSLTTFESSGLPNTGGSGTSSSLRSADHWRLLFTNINTPVTINSIPYNHNSLIEYANGSWLSSPINYGYGGSVPVEDTDDSTNVVYRGDWTSLESSTFPTTGGSGAGGALRVSDHWRVQFTNVNNTVNIGGVPYYHNSIIEYAGAGYWISYPINYGSGGVTPTEDSAPSTTVPFRGDWSNFESLNFPTTGGSGTAGAFRLGDHWRLVFTSVNTPKTVNGIDYTHNTIIEYAGSGNWISYKINYGN